MNEYKQTILLREHSLFPPPLSFRRIYWSFYHGSILFFSILNHSNWLVMAIFGFLRRSAGLCVRRIQLGICASFLRLLSSYLLTRGYAQIEPSTELQWVSCYDRPLQCARLSVS